MSSSIWNISSLILIQASNALFPIIIIPFILYKNGPVDSAKIVLTELISLVVTSISMYSFDIDSVASIKNRKNNNDWSHELSRTLISRLIIFFPTSVVALFLSSIYSYEVLVLTSCWILNSAATITQSAWFYQVVGELKITATALFFGRILSVAMILICLSKGVGIWSAPLLWGAFSLISVILSQFITMKKMGLKISAPSITKISMGYRLGFPIFISNQAVFLYREANSAVIALLGFSAFYISSYAFSEKIVKLAQASVRPINQFIVPKIINKTNYLKLPNLFSLRSIIRAAKNQLIVAVILVPLLWFSGDLYFKLVSANKAVSILSSELTRIMSLAILFGVINFIFGMVGLNTLGARKYFGGSVLISGFLGLSLCYLLSNKFGIYGTAWSFVFSEAILTLMILIRYFKERTII